MDLATTVEVNKKIMDLIKSKYSDSFPLGYNNPDSQYYYLLNKANAEAEAYLERSKQTIPRSM